MDSITSLFIVYRYDNTTGTFTVPPAGDGFYYFSTHLHVRKGDYSYFDIQMNGNTLCTAFSDHLEGMIDAGPAVCSAIAYATPGISFLLSSTADLLYFVSRLFPQIRNNTN